MWLSYCIACCLHRALKEKVPNESAKFKIRTGDWIKDLALPKRRNKLKSEATTRVRLALRKDSVTGEKQFSYGIRSWFSTKNSMEGIQLGLLNRLCDVLDYKYITQVTVNVINHN